jgi:hypothetical protein
MELQCHSMTWHENVMPAVGKEKQCNATGWQSWEMQCQYLARTGVDAVELAQCTQYNALKATKL